MIVGLCRPHRRLPETRWLRRRVRIVRCALDVAASRPESRAAHLVRIRLARDRIRPRTLRRAPSRKSRRRQVEAPPEKMHRARFTYKSRAKFLKLLFAARQNPPKTVGVLRIVGSVLRVLVKRDRVRNLHRHPPDFH